MKVLKDEFVAFRYIAEVEISRASGSGLGMQNYVSCISSFLMVAEVDHFSSKDVHYFHSPLFPTRMKSKKETESLKGDHEKKVESQKRNFDLTKVMTQYAIGIPLSCG